MTAIATADLLTIAVTSYVLAQHLGPNKQWVDLLNDCRRGRSDPDKPQLLPFGPAKTRTGRVKQPLYHPERVRQFIAEMREFTGMSKPFRYTRQAYSFADVPGLDDGFWRVRILTPVGAPSTKRAGKSA